MPSLKHPDIRFFPKIAEIQVLWIVFSGEMEGYCFFRAEPESIKWLKPANVLRFNAVCVEGDDSDLPFDIAFKNNGIVLRYDFDDGTQQSVPMRWFEGPSGLMLDHRTRTEFLSVCITPSKKTRLAG